MRIAAAPTPTKLTIENCRRILNMLWLPYAPAAKGEAPPIWKKMLAQRGPVELQNMVPAKGEIRIFDRAVFHSGPGVPRILLRQQDVPGLAVPCAPTCPRLTP